MAIQRVQSGWSQAAVSEFLGVHAVTVAKWVARFRSRGEPGLDAKPVAGRPRFLSPEQERLVVAWLADKPTAHGFRTDLWTARRVADLIRRKFNVVYHPNYLREWLSKRGYSPQKPRRRPRQRNEATIDQWLATEWPRIQKKRRRRALTWF
jgi:transposase